MYVHTLDVVTHVYLCFLFKHHVKLDMCGYVRNREMSEKKGEPKVGEEKER